MLDTLSSPILPSELPPSSAVYVIRVAMNDGKTVFPVFISTENPNCRDQLLNASHYFEALYSGQGVVSVELANTLYEAGVADVSTVTPWSHYEQKILSPEAPDEFLGFLKTLSSKGISATVIDHLTRDRNFQDNEQQLLVYLDIFVTDETKNADIKRILEIAKSRHGGDFYGIDKYPSTAVNADVPYVNHSIQMATQALKMKKWQPSADAIQAILLHDVVEDTDTTIEDLREHVSPRVLEILKDVSRGHDESREQFMERVSQLQGESKIIKCLDRLHNLLRSFSILDKTYLTRYTAESRSVYLPCFLEYPELSELAPIFNHYLVELEKLLLSLK